MRRLFPLLAALLLCAPVLAVLPDEKLDDPVLEARARAITQTLRCVVCQNQSIDDSDAPLARDLRIVVREQLRMGKSDNATIDYVVARYGNFVLLKPPVEPATWALWVGPFLLLLFGSAALIFWRRRAQPAPLADAPLSPDEAKALEALSAPAPPAHGRRPN
jgi:cytochrome c-type biogenesis protein CcmH